VETAIATDQFVAAARIRFGSVRLEEAPLLLVRSQFGFAESLVCLSQLTGNALLQGKSFGEALLPLQDAAGIVQAVDLALPVLGVSELLRKLARDWSTERVAREAGDRGRALAEVNELLEREQRFQRRFDMAVGQVDVAEIPPRLPSARAQIDVCRGAIGRLRPRTKWVSDALLRTLGGGDANELTAEQRGELRLALTEQDSNMVGEFEVVAQALRTAYGELAPFEARTLDIRRLSYDSPLEMVVALPGVAAGIVAVLNQVLKFKANYKARNEADLAVQVNLEKEIAENRLIRDACIELRKRHDAKILGDLSISEVEVLDDPDDDWDWPSDDV
jgi:hypothetical protein